MIHIPDELVATQVTCNGEAGRAFVAALPELAADFVGRWQLRQTGSPMHGWCALVLPVERADGTPAALKRPAAALGPALRQRPGRAPRLAA
ncbi:hypothetical protein [Streptomyces sp. NBC_00829]|uniref:hypothetical protein n=1 Tax=Streptomyces sp. NBC_00829 TaxID=2903679 RepID=UPI00386FE102